MSAPSVASLFEDSLRHHRAGRLVDAQAGYRQVLSRDSNHADALHLLGIALHQAGGPGDESIRLIQRAIGRCLQ